MGKKNFTVIIFLFLLLLLAGGYFYWTKFLEEETVDPLLEKIRTEGKIVVGTDATFPPFESIDEEGNFFGFDIDFAREISKDLGVRAEFKNINWERLFDSLLEGEVDLVVAAITITSERAKIMDFSDPYFNAGQVIVTTKEKIQFIRGVEDLDGKKLAAQIETTGKEEAKKLTDPSLVFGYESYALATEALLREEVDAIIVDYPAAAELIKEEENLKIVGEPFTQEFYGAAVRPEEKALLSYVNRTIRRLKHEGKLKELEEKWLNE